MVSRMPIIVTIFKKVDKTDCLPWDIPFLNFRKNLCENSAFRLGTVAESILPETQSGFRPGRGTVDMIFAAYQIQEKCFEQHRELYMAFINLTKTSSQLIDQPYGKSLVKMDALVNS